jgi:hypothetical protein
MIVYWHERQSDCLQFIVLLVFIAQRFYLDNSRLLRSRDDTLWFHPFIKVALRAEELGTKGVTRVQPQSKLKRSPPASCTKFSNRACVHPSSFYSLSSALASQCQIRNPVPVMIPLMVPLMAKSLVPATTRRSWVYNRVVEQDLLLVLIVGIFSGHADQGLLARRS